MNSNGNLAQAAVLRGLLHPSCYPHAVAHIEWIETHISTVLLAGDYAYKFKKPVNLGFLDFTTLELRHHFCEEELRLNRRSAPRLYLDVVAIVGTVDRPLVGSSEAPDAIEYAVRMRRFSQSALLDHMLASEKLTPQHLDALAETVAAFHARIAGVARTGNTDKENGYGTAASIAIPMRQNFAQIRPLLETEEEIAILDRLEEWSLAKHAELSLFMDMRKLDGFVRECHGDLHLGNIIWSDGEIQVFDCLEFNPSLRWIDVASEIAFTLMDLIARGRPDWGARFLNDYLEITGDYAALRLLPYYLVYRAMVRAKVARIRATQERKELSQAALADYTDHIRLADSFTTPGRAALMITRGVSGTGKTTLSQPLLERLGAVRLRSDVVRKGLHGLTRESRSDSVLGAGLYADAVSLATYDELRRLATLALEAGYPVIVDATFLRRSQRMAFYLTAKEMNIPFLILDCRADADELRRRITQRLMEGRDASEASGAVLEWQLQHDEALDAQEMDSAMVIDTQKGASNDIFAGVRQRLSP
ncbi:MAG: AAA family ATPase [Sterolibacterium sp.]|nr:AAA family ATPase [Sterolibacterium sp.]